MSGHIDRAVFFSERGRHQDAVRELLAHLRDDSENGYVHGMLALELGNLGQIEQGRTHAQKSIGLLPEDSFSYYTMAHVCVQGDQMPAAAEWITEAIERDPNNATYFHVLAIIRGKQGLYRDSLEVIDQCLALDPEHHGCLELKSAVELAQGKPQTAAMTAREVLSLAPESSIAHINQSYYALEQGHNQRAFESIREGLRLDPQSVPGRLALRHALNFTNPILITLFFVHIVVARAAPLALMFLAWLFIGMETPASSAPAAENLDQIVGTLIIYGLALLVVLVKPIGDFYVQLFRGGRKVIDRSELQVSGCLLLLGLAYFAALWISLSLGVPSSGVTGFFLFIACNDRGCAPHRDLHLGYSASENAPGHRDCPGCDNIATLTPLDSGPVAEPRSCCGDLRVASVGRLHVRVLLLAWPGRLVELISPLASRLYRRHGWPTISKFR